MGSTGNEGFSPSALAASGPWDEGLAECHAESREMVLTGLEGQKFQHSGSAPAPPGVLSARTLPLPGRKQRGAVSTGHGARGGRLSLAGAAASLQQKRP